MDICDICSNVIPGDDVFVKASSQINKQVSFIRNEDNLICPNCISTYLQMNRIIANENKLMSLYSRTLKLRQYEWSDKTTTIQTYNYVNQIMQLQDCKDDDIYKELIKPIKYKKIKVQPLFQQYDEIATSVMGVGLPENVHVPYLKPNLIECPCNDFGFIELPRKNDFIIFVKSNFDEISILEQSLNEMKPISRGDMASRAGSAGGYMLPSNECKSLSTITKNERLLCVRKKSVGMSVTYRNKNGEVKGRNSVYNDLYMSRFCSKKKFKLVKRSTAYQRLLIKEMVSRLKAFILLDRCDVIPIHTSIFAFMTYSAERINREKEFEATGKSKLESKLLSWACCTGEMRNHQAVKSHYDGNTSHPVESMSLFGRLPVNMRNVSVDYVKEMAEGYLLLPLEGLTIKIKCGYDLMHCSLKSTLHLADNTRNSCNWSRVHGP